MAALTSASERRGEYFRAAMRSRGTFWGVFAALAASVIAGGVMNDVRLVIAGPVAAALLIALGAHRSATARAESDFFTALAPTLGLNYTLGGDYVPITPLLAAGDRRRFEHTMEGPLFGRAGGPPCMVGHYTYDTRHDAEVGGGMEVKGYRPHPFTICAIDVGAPIARFRGLYLRPRLSGLGLDHDWLGRAPKPQPVELESTRFNEVFDLRRAKDQDELALRELFSPSFVVWLSEHPLHPGFECKAGTLVVFVPGHEGSAGRLTLLHEAAREITRRVAKQVEQDAHFSAAGHTIL